MAIRPVDLQLAYLAAPQNAAVVSSAQEAPRSAQAAAASAFAAEVTKREESVDQPERTESAKVRPRGDRDRPQRNPYQGRRRNPAPDADVPSPEPIDLSDDGEHIIDVTA
jgi:hypothetical protein